jgi:type II secretory pathway component PulK
MQDRRGSILVLVLFVMTVLSLAAMSFSYRAGLKSRAVHQRALAAQLSAQARSAVAVAIGRLKENTNEFDHPAEPWHFHPPLASEDWLNEWSSEDSAFLADYQVSDEEGKLNLMFASSEAFHAAARRSFAALSRAFPPISTFCPERYWVSV